MYGLNEDDIREVETWYARRYPKLAKHVDAPGITLGTSADINLGTEQETLTLLLKCGILRIS